MELLVRTIEFGMVARDRKLGISLARCAIVVENAEQNFVARNAGMGDRLNALWIIVVTGYLRKNSKIASVNQDRRFHTQRPLTVGPRGVSKYMPAYGCNG